MFILGEVITLKMAYGDTTPMRNINGILMALLNSLFPLFSLSLSLSLSLSSITRITRVNNIFFCCVAISDDTSAHADFQVDGYHGC